VAAAPVSVGERVTLLPTLLYELLLQPQTLLCSAPRFDLASEFLAALEHEGIELFLRK
jgi:hypothetical protein